MILDQQQYDIFLRDYDGDAITFEEYINVELGNLFDNDRKIEEILPNEDRSSFVIIYTVRL